MSIIIQIRVDQQKGKKYASRLVVSDFSVSASLISSTLDALSIEIKNAITKIAEKGIDYDIHNTEAKIKKYIESITMDDVMPPMKDAIGAAEQ